MTAAGPLPTDAASLKAFLADHGFTHHESVDLWCRDGVGEGTLRVSGDLIKHCRADIVARVIVAAILRGDHKPEILAIDGPAGSQNVYAMGTPHEVRWDG